MIDSCMDNVLNKYLEGVITMQDREIQGLLKERGDAEARCQRKDRDIEALMEHINLLGHEIRRQKAITSGMGNACDLMEEEVDDLEHEILGLKDQREHNHRRLDEKDKIIKGLEERILALQIQAAESEHRADEERRGRLQLVMRM